MTTPVGVDQVMLCLREDVKNALDVMETARTNAQIDRCIRSATTMIHGQMARIFYPLQKTARLDWPNIPSGNSGYPWRIWLDAQELISLDTFVSGGVVIPPSGYLLEPTNEGPPYSHIDVNLGSQYAFSSTDTWQQSQVPTGLFGYTATTTPAGTLAADMTDTTGTTCTLTDTAGVGVGSILQVDSERLMVTGRKMVTTSQTLQADMGLSMAAETLTVTDSTKYDYDEILLLDAERMLIVDIAGENLIVKRAFDGSTLAAHSGSTIYCARQLTVLRGALGTTAAAHTATTAVAAHAVPGGIRNLCIAEALSQLLSEQSGYARTVGSGDSTRNASGAGLKDLWAKAITAYARQSRLRSV